jgi:pimeloyl-ACP methyl ester carboxylesterase
LPTEQNLGSPAADAPLAPVRAAAPETPFLLSVAGTPVYAVFHAAAPGRPGAPVVVHVHGLGVEQITLYRQEVLAARAAAARGFPVLRFHARGHGDSGGSSADVTLDSLVADARAAADEARRRSGSARIVWLGVRMGALVAALAGGPGSGRDDAAGFILWEPVEKPADFFRQQLRTLLFSQVAGGKKPDATVDQLLARLEAEGSLDILGYTLQRSLVQSLGNASLAPTLTGGRARVRLAQVQARARLAPAHAQLLEALAAAGADVQSALIVEEPGYQLMSNPAWQCEALTRVTMEWLDALA